MGGPYSLIASVIGNTCAVVTEAEVAVIGMTCIIHMVIYIVAWTVDMTVCVCVCIQFIHTDNATLQSCPH